MRKPNHTRLRCFPAACLRLNLQVASQRSGSSNPSHAKDGGIGFELYMLGLEIRYTSEYWKPVSARPTSNSQLHLSSKHLQSKHAQRQVPMAAGGMRPPASTTFILQ